MNAKLLAAAFLALIPCARAGVIDFASLPLGPVTLATLNTRFAALGVTFDAIFPETLEIVEMATVRCEQRHIPVELICW